MPDILSPLIDSQPPLVDTSNINTNIAIMPFTPIPIKVPDILKESQPAFTDYGSEIPLNDFSSIVNNKLTPTNIKDELIKQKELNDLKPNLGAPVANNMNFRYFKNNDALRYRQNDRLFKEVGYNPEMPHDILDAQYDHNETTWESIKNVFPKLWATASFQFKNYFQEYADAAQAIGKMDFNVLQDQQRFNDFTQHSKDLEDLYPDYQSDKPVQWWQLGRGDYWEQTGSSLGFTIGTIGAALLENAIIGLGTGGIGEIGELPNSARKVFKSIADYYSLKRAYGLVKGVIGAKSIVGGLGSAANIWRLINGALSEATYDVSSNTNQFLETYKNDYITKYGVAPSKGHMEELSNSLKKGNNVAILLETPFLLFSNSAQFGNILAPKLFGRLLESPMFKLLLGPEAKVGVKEIGADAIKNKFARFGMNVFNMVKNGFWEGTEELYQSLVTTATNDYYKDKILNQDDASIMKSLGTGMDYIASNEGLIQFTSGFSTGSIFHFAGKPFAYFAKPKLTTNEKTGEKEYKFNFLNKLGIGMEAIQKQNEKQKFQRVADYLNTTTIDDVMKEEGFLNYIKDKKTALTLAKYVQNNDLFNMRNAQNLQLNRMLYAGLVTGKIDLQIAKLQQFAQQDFNTLDDYFNLNIDNQYDTADSKQQFLDNFRGFANSLVSKSSEFERIFNKEKANSDKLLQSISDAHSNNVDKLNLFGEELRNKYGTDDIDELNLLKRNNKIDHRDYEMYRTLNQNTIVSQLEYYATNEAVKAAVFSQVGMNEDAKRASEIVKQLIKNNTVNANYQELSSIFDIGQREIRMKQLKEKLSTVSDADKPIIGEQVDNFKKLNEALNKEFEEGKSYNVNRVAKLTQNYIYSIQKEVNKLFNHNTLENRIDGEKDNQLDLLSKFVKLQKQHQENLNLYNYVSTAGTKSEYIKFQSNKILEFFQKAVDFQKNVEQKDAENTVVKKGDKFEVHTPDGKIFGTYDTEEQANAEVSKLNTPAPKEELMFNVGDKKYNTYTELDRAHKDGDITLEQFNTAVDEYNNKALPEDNVDKKKPGTTEDIPTETQDIAINESKKALAIMSSLKSSIRQTTGIDKNDEELDDSVDTPFAKVIATPYDMQVSNFIIHDLPTLSSGIYTPYIVKDNDELMKRLKTPLEKKSEVIVFKDSEGKIKTFDNGLPIVMSFNEKAFDKHIEARINARNKELGVTDSAKVFADEKESAKKAREMLQKGLVDEIEIVIDPESITGGIYEKTNEGVPVGVRFPDFKLHVITTEGGENIGGQIFTNKDVVALIGNNAIAIIPQRISADKELKDNIEALLIKTYTSKNDARAVISYLKNILFVTDKNYFRIITDEYGNHTIQFIKDGKNASTSNITNDKTGMRINIKLDAMKNGYTKVTPTSTGIKKEEISAEDYNKWINDRVITNRRVVYKRNEDGTINKNELYFGTVNPYFNFSFKSENLSNIEEVKKLDEKRKDKQFVANQEFISDKEALAKRTEEINKEFQENVTKLKDHPTNIVETQPTNNTEITPKSGLLDDSIIAPIINTPQVFKRKDSKNRTFIVNFSGDGKFSYENDPSKIPDVEEKKDVVTSLQGIMKAHTFTYGNTEATLIGNKDNGIITLDNNFRVMDNIRVIELQFSNKIFNDKYQEFQNTIC